MGTGADVCATIGFADGSMAAISYLTEGSPRFPKETLDVFGDRRTGRLDNFQRVTVWSGKGKRVRRVLAGQDKGQRSQLTRFVDAVRTGSAMPIPLDSLAATTRATLAVDRSLATHGPVTL
jgi:predicted dehydrogenase